ncbi:MAG: TIGR03905 family TSCPD domain-containing protein [Muribaculaceae bacterium]|nr:TIGR03905 family TSCPD domain-containing protein [Muribaculaceae bacterium]MDE6360575.1 TIGR03905 family TSCPD domain-containing protein [Muribaculaceae bacterium]
MRYRYMTRGTCSRMIEIEMEDGIVKEVAFTGGCHGNLQGIGRLVEGMRAEEVIARLEGIRCGAKETSCPDQLARALRGIAAGEAGA